MSEDLFSQEEIDKLLQANNNDDKSQIEMMKEEKEKLNSLGQDEIDLIGELANISFGSASTALSSILNKQVIITTPVVEVVDIEESPQSEGQEVILTVDYVKGLHMQNLLVISKEVALVIADLMMMGTGEIDINKELTEMELSAVQEAMNQMMGSAATAMSEMFQEVVDISPPGIVVNDVDTETQKLSQDTDNKKVAKISFDLEIKGFVNSKLVQLVSLENAKQMAGKLLVKTGTPERKVENADIDVPDKFKDVTGNFINEMANVLSMIINKNATVDKTAYDPFNKGTVTQYMLPILLEGEIQGKFYVLFGRKFASVVSDLMMMGSGETNKEITDFELSALQEAFSQMFLSSLNNLRNTMERDVTLTLNPIENFNKSIIKNYGDNLIEVKPKIKTDLGDLELSALFNNDIVSQIVGDVSDNLAEEEIADNGIFEIKPLLDDIEVQLEIVFGKTQKSIKDLLSMQFGEVVNLKENVDDPLRVYANGILVAEGDVVNADGYFGLKVTKVY